MVYLLQEISWGGGGGGAALIQMNIIETKSMDLEDHWHQTSRRDPKKRSPAAFTRDWSEVWNPVQEALLS